MKESKKLILAGFGGFGREVAAWVAAADMPYVVVGHIDDEKFGDPMVIDRIIDHSPLLDVEYITCFGNGAVRRKVRIQLEARGAKMGVIVAPGIIYATSPYSAKNSLFLGISSISNNVTLGNDILVQSMAVIGHDVEIADGVTISSHAFVGGGAKLGRCCTIHPHAVVLPHVEIGEGAVVGAGSVVIRDVEPYTTVFGTPAKMISRVEPHD